MRKGIYGGAFVGKMEEAVRLGGISHPLLKKCLRTSTPTTISCRAQIKAEGHAVVPILREKSNLPDK
jgi:hypothetical protein